MSYPMLKAMWNRFLDWEWSVPAIYFGGLAIAMTAFIVISLIAAVI